MLIPIRPLKLSSPNSQFPGSGIWGFSVGEIVIPPVIAMYVLYTREKELSRHVREAAHLFL